jgi:glycosyltransferase involved in cell wall biosynthesis
MVRRVFGWHNQIPGCAYYRLQLPLSTLNEHPAGNWDCMWGERLPLPASMRDRPGTTMADVVDFMAERYDVIIAQQVGAGGTGAEQTFQALARSGKFFTVLETDDNLMALHSGHLEEARREMEQRAKAYVAAAEVADLVTVTTPALAEVMSGINPNVRIIPNYIDRAMFDLPGGGQHVPPTRMVEPGGWSRMRAGWPGPEQMLIGWGGSSTHRVDFDVAWPGLQRLLSKRPEVCFASMGVAFRANDPALAKLERRGQFAGLRWMDMTKERWSDYYRRVGWYDIGLAPLEMNAFNASKSWIKILEYCAMGVPFVASASPEYRRFLETDLASTKSTKTGPFGYLVQSEHDWYPTLAAITSDWAELRRMQARARIYARQFTIQGHIGEWASALAGQGASCLSAISQRGKQE